MFNDNSKAIYLQIADRIIDSILAATLKEGDRLPSIREFAAEMQVNPNTMMRTYDYLCSHGVIYNRRGIGYFLAEGATATVTDMKRKELMGDEIGYIFRQLSLLGVSPDMLRDEYSAYLKKEPES